MSGIYWAFEIWVGLIGPLKLGLGKDVDSLLFKWTEIKYGLDFWAFKIGLDLLGI